MIDLLFDGDHRQEIVGPPPTGFSLGKGHLSVFDSKLLTTHEWSATSSKLFIISDGGFKGSVERPRGTMGEVVDGCPNESIAIDIRLDGPVRATIVRGLGRSIPLYASRTGQKLVVSWKIENCIANLEDRTVDVQACRRYLEYGDRMVRNEVFEGLFKLWPGETLEFDGKSIEISRSSELPVVRSTALSDDAHATDYLVELLAKVVEPFLDHSKAPLIELSGGYDSSLVAIAAARKSDDLRSYGLIHQGPVGRQQENRRRQVIEICKLDDHAFPSWRSGPLDGLTKAECTVALCDDNHRSACAEALDALADQEIDLVLTGVGGDELSMETTYGRLDFEIGSHACLSGVVTGAARADMFMRRGIWPVNPLLDRRVVDLC